MKRVEYLEKKGIKSIEDMSKGQLECFTNEKLNLYKLKEYFLVTKLPWCIFTSYSLKDNAKQDFYITEEILNDILG